MPSSYPAVFADSAHDHQPCVDHALAEAEQICLDRGQRFTAIRRKVLELIWQQHKPIGAYQILEELQQESRTAPPTVYRALDFLLNLGLIHRIASLNAFVGCVHPQAAHEGYFLICNSCRTCAELDAGAVTRVIHENARQCGFVVQDSAVEVMGLCPECSTAEDQP
jgi:Fur family transcriptional regulator, zinc uptake regulator